MRSAFLTVSLTVALFGPLSLGACGIQEHNAPAGVNSIPGSGGGAGGASASGGAGEVSAGGAGENRGGSAGGENRGGSGGSAGSGGRTAGAGGGTSSNGGSGGGGQSGAGSGGAGGAGMPTGDGVTIEGTFIPRDKAIVILHFGHSNMQGQAEDPLELRPYFFSTQPRLWRFRGGTNFTLAVEPTASDRNRDSAGPGLALLKAAAAGAPDDYHFISVGYGVGSATSLDWSKGGLHYSRVMNLAVQLKGKVTFGAAIIMLGITDRHMPAAEQPGFADRVVKIVADVRADLGAADLPVLHTDYEVESTGSLAVTGQVGRFFRPLILMLPDRVSRLAIVPTDNLGMQDDHHFDLSGQKDWSDRAIKILVDKGWAPWPRNQ